MRERRPGDVERRRALLEAILGSAGERTVLLSPFHAAFGSNVHIGDDFFGNVNLTSSTMWTSGSATVS